MPVPREDRRALGALLLVQIFFGTFPVLGKIALQEVSPFVLASFRALFGALFLSLFAHWFVEDAPPANNRERWLLFVLSLLGIVANQVFFIQGLARTTATNATILVMTIPIFTLSVALLTGNEKLERRRALGIPLAFSGVLLLLDLDALRFGSTTFLGDMLITLNGLCYAIFLVLSRRVLSRRPSMDFIARVFRYGALPILLFAVPDLSRFRPQTLSLKTWGAIAGVVLLSTVATYALNAWALARTSASTTAFFIFIQPLISGFLAAFVLGERPGPKTLLAAVLIAAGVILATVRLSPSRKKGGVQMPPRR